MCPPPPPPKVAHVTPSSWGIGCRVNPLGMGEGGGGGRTNACYPCAPTTSRVGELRSAHTLMAPSAAAHMPGAAWRHISICKAPRQTASHEHDRSFVLLAPGRWSRHRPTMQCIASEASGMLGVLRDRRLQAHCDPGRSCQPDAAETMQPPPNEGRRAYRHECCLHVVAHDTEGCLLPRRACGQKLPLGRLVF